MRCDTMRYMSAVLYYDKMNRIPLGKIDRERERERERVRERERDRERERNDVLAKCMDTSLNNLEEHDF